MEFGKVADPSLIDFSLPADEVSTTAMLARQPKNLPFQVYIGCPSWSRGSLKGFYPRGTKDELSYYATQFNSIELNTTYYRMPELIQVETWRNKTPSTFRFFPKINDEISHKRRLTNTDDEVATFCAAIAGFEDRLGPCFLQLPENFSPTEFSALRQFVRSFPKEQSLAVEVRNQRWFQQNVADDLMGLLAENKMSHIITDVPGRRDMLHMRLTTPDVFIRFVGANHPTDFTRLDDWVIRIKQWRNMGLQKVYFFIHQLVEEDLPMLSSHLIRGLNSQLGTDIKDPGQPVQGSLF